MDLTTDDTDSPYISNENVIEEKEVKFLTFQDIEIFKCHSVIHTKEHTSLNQYLCITSAHPRNTFRDIVKGQMNRLRRLCSRDSDFQEAIKGIELRCKYSGYENNKVTEENIQKMENTKDMKMKA